TENYFEAGDKSPNHLSDTHFRYQPSSADISGGSNQRRKLAAPPMNVSLDHSEGSLLSEDTLDTEDDGLDTGDDLDVNLDELDTPDEADSLELNKHGDTASRDPGHRAAEESRLWRSVVIGEQEHRIDMKCIEPYKRVISHGGIRVQILGVSCIQGSSSASA
uniref:Uncharacterized protein n=1 Tax=Neolamprologus brichardi TaxID=32507 RepID=A0A3Q4GRG6_NEOBR